jgi:hypothetical protein
LCNIFDHFMSAGEMKSAIIFLPYTYLKSWLFLWL